MPSSAFLGPRTSFGTCFPAFQYMHRELTDAQSPSRPEAWELTFMQDLEDAPDVACAAFRE